LMLFYQWDAGRIKNELAVQFQSNLDFQPNRQY
jgi:hypothetical protein